MASAIWFLFAALPLVTIGLDIHIRTEIQGLFSIISDIAVKIGNDVLEVGLGGQAYINGISSEDGSPPAEYLGPFPLHYHYENKHHYYEILLAGDDDGERIVVKASKKFMGIAIEAPTEENFGDSVGLSGSFEQGKMLARDGKTENSNGNAHGPEWQVLGTEPRLFQLARYPQYPEVCIPPPMKTNEARRLGEKRFSRELAEQACERFLTFRAQFEACVFDVVVTGDLEAAEAGSF